MKQLFQDMEHGHLKMLEVPVAPPGAHEVVVQVRASIISSGTERALVTFGQAGWVGKALQQRERVRQVAQKARAEGVLATAEAVQAKLHTPLPLGYAAAGVVTAVGPLVRDLRVGDRVCCNGAHAQVVTVPALLCARMPDGLSFEDAAFASLASIALHGIRLAEISLGERVAVIGLGLVGQLAAQLLHASGCEVLGVEPDAARRELARSLAHCAVASPEDALAHSEFDAVLICAATRDAAPLQQAIALCRRRARIVLVGVVDITMPRRELFEKELTFQVSASYGPGRYERAYERFGQDYAPEHVRWTARRNFTAALTQMQRGALQCGALISARFAFERAAEAYEHLLERGEAMAIMLEYASGAVSEGSVKIEPPLARRRALAGAPRLAVVGAGNYAHRTFLPLLALHDVEPVVIASAHGTNAAWLGERFGFEHAAASAEQVFARSDIDVVAILTRHDTHASLAQRALELGHHVFVEKPLARTLTELEAVERAGRAASGTLSVGFNRRFAPMTQALQHALKGRKEPCSLLMTINAGALPADHWLFDAEQGGRILGEACHFIDLARALTGSPIVSVHAVSTRERDASVTLLLGFEDGSRATILYETRGAPGFAKERIEVFSQGRIARIDAWRKLSCWGWSELRAHRTLRPQKGHAQMLEALLTGLKTAAPLIPLEELFEVSRAAIQAAEQVSS